MFDFAAEETYNARGRGPLHGKSTSDEAQTALGARLDFTIRKTPLPATAAEMVSRAWT